MARVRIRSRSSGEGPAVPVSTSPRNPWPGFAPDFKLRQLPYDELKQGSALAIPYPDNAFEKVFSHGVLHHIPDIQLAEREIARVPVGS